MAREALRKTLADEDECKRLAALEQGSDEWLTARKPRWQVIEAMASSGCDEQSKVPMCGCVTATAVSTLCGYGYDATGEHWLTRLFGLMDVREDEPNDFMRALFRMGHAGESLAIALLERYIFENQVCVADSVGLVPHPSIPHGAMSPDGIVEDSPYGTFLVECKTALRAPHDLLSGVYGAGASADKVRGYIIQMMWQMACLPEATHVCFVSLYSPHLADEVTSRPSLRRTAEMVVCRLERCDEFIAVLERLVDGLADLEARMPSSGTLLWSLTERTRCSLDGGGRVKLPWDLLSVRKVAHMHWKNGIPVHAAMLEKLGGAGAIETLDEELVRPTAALINV